jgi:hypothetical protein
MALSPEDKAELQALIGAAVTAAIEGPAVRAVIIDAVGGLVQGLQRHLDQQILELQADVDLAVDKLDSFEIDVKVELKDIKTHVTKLSRERFRDVRREELSRERELSALTEIEALKFRVSKLEKGPTT